MHNKNIQFFVFEEKTHIHSLVKIGKWVMDKIGAIIGITIMLILFPLVAILIKIDSKGPILFTQIRVGKSNKNLTKIFLIYKFRTMRSEPLSNSNDFIWTKSNDPRMTKIGRFLRKYRIDELPQFINVLKGDMSLVGPRPMPPIFFRELEKLIPFYCERMESIAPGITGLAQIYIDREVESHDLTKKVSYEHDKVAHDHSYAISLSKPLQWLYVDMKIILLTLKNVIMGKGS